MAGRCTKGFLEIMDVTETIATTRAEYVDIAVALGTNATLRAGVSAKIAANADRLWTRRATIPEWVQFFDEAYQKKPITNLHSRKNPGH